MRPRQICFLPLPLLVRTKFWLPYSAQGSKNSCQVILSGHEEGEEMNNVAEKLLRWPPLMLLSTLSLHCLVCFAALNIWTGCRAISPLRHHDVYFKWHVQLSWERIFLFSGRIASMDFILSWQSVIEQRDGGVVGRWREALMCRWRTAKCSVERTAGFVAVLKAQSATAALANSEFDMVDMLESVSVPQALPWLLAKSQLAIRRPSKIARVWE